MRCEFATSQLLKPGFYICQKETLVFATLHDLLLRSAEVMCMKHYNSMKYDLNIFFKIAHGD